MTPEVNVDRRACVRCGRETDCEVLILPAWYADQSWVRALGWSQTPEWSRCLHCLWWSTTFVDHVEQTGYAYQAASA